MTLREGQYKLGDTVFGAGTMIRVNGVSATGYVSNASDYQNPLADEIRFGKDTLTPSTLLFEIGVVDNYALPGYSLPGIVPGNDLLESLNKEWRADEIRNLWGAQKHITYRRDDQERRVYGRPRKFEAQPRRKKPGFLTVTADYQRADTFSYDETEKSVLVAPGAPANLVRSGGKAPTWVQIFIVGPIANPAIAFGGLFTLAIAHTLTAGKVIEINSYPWERRAINSDGMNLNAKLVAPSPYLDLVRIPAETTTTVALAGTGTTGATQAIVNWREAHYAF